jgi:hypothetical protein
MTINQRKKGHDFERKISKKLQEDLSLKRPVRRILTQYQEKNHPDLKLGRWNIECKAYKKGFEPPAAWWKQVLGVTSRDEFPVLVYKFDNKPIRVRLQTRLINKKLSNSKMLIDLNWDSFIYLLETMYKEDFEPFL